MITNERQWNRKKSKSFYYSCCHFDGRLLVYWNPAMCTRAHDNVVYKTWIVRWWLIVRGPPSCFIQRRTFMTIICSTQTDTAVKQKTLFVNFATGSAGKSRERVAWILYGKFESYDEFPLVFDRVCDDIECNFHQWNRKDWEQHSSLARKRTWRSDIFSHFIAKKLLNHANSPRRRHCSADTRYHPQMTPSLT